MKKVCDCSQIKESIKKLERDKEYIDWQINNLNNFVKICEQKDHPQIPDWRMPEHLK